MSDIGGYIEIGLPVDGEAAEAVCELFERHGGGAVVEIRVRDATSGQDLPQREHWVRTYLPAGDLEARRRVEEGLWYLGRIHPIPEAAIRKLAEANWAEAWKEHYTPLRAGRRFLIVPSWIDPAEAGLRDDDRLLRLDPGMAFGTGLHPTTRLCLALMEDELQAGQRMLDVGTGSGVLAIAGLRLGAAEVLGVDIDPGAIEIARANAALNGLAPELAAGGIEAAGDGPPYDLVVANILVGILVELAPRLAERCRPGGRLIVSGILDTQAEQLRAALEPAGFRWRADRAEGDWLGQVYDRSATADGELETASDAHGDAHGAGGPEVATR